jgi:hypothetical protein
MNEGESILLSDKRHKAIVTKVLDGSFIIECTDRQLSFVRLVENDNINDGIKFGSWEKYFYERN